MSELKPCPFCGESHAVLLKPTCKQTDAYDSHDRAFPMVCCPLCNAEKHGDNWDQSGESAIKAWNTRTTETALAAAEARIAEQDQYIAELRHYNGGLANESCQQQERIAALEKALEPFAREEVSGMYKDAWHLQFSDPEGFVDFTDFTIGDLRRAAALLKEKE